MAEAELFHNVRWGLTCYSRSEQAESNWDCLTIPSGYDDHTRSVRAT